jgi:hypothetical protein
LSAKDFRNHEHRKKVLFSLGDSDELAKNPILDALNDEKLKSIEFPQKSGKAFNQLIPNKQFFHHDLRNNNKVPKWWFLIQHWTISRKL